MNQVAQHTKMPVYNECINCKKLFEVRHRSRRYCFACVPPRNSGRGHNRHLVRARDGFACQDCGVTRFPYEVLPGMKSLDVHHINGLCGKKTKGYDRKEDMDSLITLCHKCHFNRHDFSKKNRKTAHA